MAYDYRSFDNRRRAKFLLDKLLPRAREKASELVEFSAESAVGMAMLPHLRLSRVEGVHVYQGEKGGWFADLVFKDVPPGVPKVIGTASNLPCSTRDEAIDQAVTMLASVIRSESNPTLEESDTKVVFEFDDAVIEIPRDVLLAVRNAGVSISADDAMERLETFRRKFGGGRRITPDTINALPKQARLELMAAVLGALTNGLFRWPLRTEQPPPPPMNKRH